MKFKRKNNKNKIKILMSNQFFLLLIFFIYFYCDFQIICGDFLKKIIIMIAKYDKNKKISEMENVPRIYFYRIRTYDYPTWHIFILGKNLT